MNSSDPNLDRARVLAQSGWKRLLSLHRYNQISLGFIISTIFLLFQMSEYFDFSFYFYFGSRYSNLATIAIVIVGTLLFAFSIRVSATMFPLVVTGAVFLWATTMFIFIKLGSYYFGGTQLAFMAVTFGPLVAGILSIIAALRIPLLSWLAQLARSFVLLGYILATAPLSFPALWIATRVIYQRERNLGNNKDVIFRQNRPFVFFGTIITKSDLMFLNASEYRDNIESIIVQIADEYPDTVQENMDIKDVASKPIYSKQFVKLTYVTKLQTRVSFIFSIENIASVLQVRWWVLLQGRIYGWDLIQFILISPLSFPFWIFRWRRNEYSILATLAGVIKHSYDVLDIETFVIAFQKDFFDKIIPYLEEQDVDVSEYQKNPPNLSVLNINGSGNNIGAVAQGVAAKASAQLQRFSGNEVQATS